EARDLGEDCTDHLAEGDRLAGLERPGVFGLLADLANAEVPHRPAKEPHQLVMLDGHLELVVYPNRQVEKLREGREIERVVDAVANLVVTAVCRVSDLTRFGRERLRDAVAVDTEPVLTAALARGVIDLEVLDVRVGTRGRYLRDRYPVSEGIALPHHRAAVDLARDVLG